MRIRYAFLLCLMFAVPTVAPAKGQTTSQPAAPSTLELVQHVSRSAVGIVSERRARRDADASFGSGFVIDADGGLVLTAAHLIRDGDDVSVIDAVGLVRRATIVASDEGFNLTLLRVEGGFDSALSFAPSPSQVGEAAFAVGRVADGRTLFVGQGIVSAVFAPPRVAIVLGFPLQRGMSGAPVVNERGEVIGIATVAASQESGALAPNGFAMPSALLQSWLSTVRH